MFPELLLFLLLPLAALSGWWIGRRSQTARTEAAGPEIPSDYLKGLNYLLNEQPDKAIEVFIQLLEVDSETVETHLALGSLFRRRGEVDRAIRIHQNLIARPTLHHEQRAQALFELGQDYMRAGLFDRAETLFGELIDSGPHTEIALHQLIDIYQQEKDWHKAIEMTQKLEAKTNKSSGPVIAQYYCELAEQEIRQGESTKALKLLRRAMTADRDCVRVSLIEGMSEKNAGNYKAAIKAFHRVEQQDADFLPEVITPLLECYSALGRAEEVFDYLHQVLARHGGISMMLVLADLLRKQEGDEKAADFITEFLRKRPSVRGMDRLIEINLQRSHDTARDNLQVLKDVTSQLLSNKPIYKCNACGFNGKTLHWQCPGCKNWNSMKPIHGVEGE